MARRWHSSPKTVAHSSTHSSWGGNLGTGEGQQGPGGGIRIHPPPPSPGAHLEAGHGPALQVGLHVARVQVGDAHQEAGPRESPELPQAETGLGTGTPPPSQLKPVAPSSWEPPRRLPLTVPTQSRSPAPLSQPHPFPFSLPRPWRAAGGAPRPLPVPQFPPIRTASRLSQGSGDTDVPKGGFPTPQPQPHVPRCFWGC